MSYSLAIRIPGLPRLQGKVHWSIATRERKRWSNAVHWHAKGKKPTEPLTRARLRFVRFSSTEPDGDNLQHSFKPLRDGLVRAGVISDDTPDVVGKPEYEWRKTRREGGFVSIEVWEG